MKLYHLSPIERMASIFKEGLVKGKECCASLEESDRIYLTTSVEKLVDSEGEWNIGDFIIYEIPISKILGIDMKVDWEGVYTKEESPYCFYIEQNIPPKSLQIVGRVREGQIKMIED